MTIEFKDLPDGGCRKWDCQACGRHLKHDPTRPVAEITGGMESSPFSSGLKFVMQHYNRLPVGTKLYATQPVGAQKVALTDGEVLQLIHCTPRERDHYLKFARSIEQAHGIKESE